MKTALSTLFFASILLTACSKNEPPQNTEPADYAETKKRLIQNPEKDSIKKDSSNVPTAMPPQATAPEENK